MAAEAYIPPSGAEEFWQRDGAYIGAMVRKLLGIGNSQDAEDVAGDITEKFLTVTNAAGQRIWEQYSPGYVSERTGRPVTWRSFLAGKVSLYVRGKREQVGRRVTREGTSLDAPAADGASTWAELFGGAAVWDDYPSLSDADFVARMRDYLAALPEGWAGPCSLFVIFDEIVQQLKTADTVNQKLLRQHLHLAAPVAEQRLAELRAALTRAAARPPITRFEVAGIRLSAVELRLALEALRNSRGNHVRRALTGHRLFGAGNKWYHAFAAAEQEKYPEICTGTGTHKVAADHVKRAVIHRFERMLAGAAGVAGPEPELTREEVLEAHLWHIPGLEPRQVDAIVTAAREVYGCL